MSGPHSRDEGQKPNVGLWNKEYAHRGIPSSRKSDASGALIWALEELGKRDKRPQAILDIGCGEGRNTFFLAKEGYVCTGIDFSSEAIMKSHHKNTAQEIEVKPTFILHDLSKSWPTEPESFDFAFDCFCFKHLIEDQGRANYKESLLRTLKPGGFYLVSFAGKKDGYYNSVCPHEAAPSDSTIIVTDPGNGIRSRLYAEEDVIAFFAPSLDFLAELTHNKTSEMHGRLYERETHALLFQKKG